MSRRNTKTSWGKAAGWYDALLESDAHTYQKEIILPGILKLLDLKKGEQVLDLACGQGFFSREIFKKGANVTGVDISPELIKIARQRSDKKIKFETAPADKLPFLDDGSVDAAIIVLAAQNIERLDLVIQEMGRVIKKSGRLVMVLNHPAFRIPRQSGWGWDSERKLQYRRVDSYLSEIKVPIQMHPSASSRRVPGKITWSFHQPLQYYFKNLIKAGFLIADFEEWISYKKSEPGPRAKAENRIRQEIPLFLAVKAVK